MANEVVRATAIVAAVALMTASGCRSGRGTAAPRDMTPAQRVPAYFDTLLPPVTDLSGTWATGTGAEPVMDTVRLHPECTYHPPAFVIRQAGNVLETWSFPESYDQGIARRDAPVAKRGTPGRISGADVIIDDGESRYVLRYDAETAHLRGTRNGERFWAARQIVIRTQVCPGVPNH